MLKARDVMTREVLTIGPDATLREAADLLVNNRISGVPVCDDGRHVLGMITEKDMLNLIFSGNFEQTRVSEAMSTKVISFPPDADIDSVSLSIGEKHIRRVPIIEKGKLVGIISRRSILRIVLDMPEKLQV